MPQIIDHEISATHVPASVSRIPALDFTKGVLVLFMVLYHWLNYFYSPVGDFYRYLRFLTPSFIFITGFLISHVYFAKYGTANGRLPRRLALRGLKILAIFIALNAVIFLLPNSPTRSILTGSLLSTDLVTIFITGNGLTKHGKYASFEILVPISYSLIVTALLLTIPRATRRRFQAVCFVMLLGMFLLWRLGIQSGNLELLTIGLFGIVFGYSSTAEVRKAASRPYILSLAYGCYLVGITIWEPFPLRAVGVFLTLIIIYAIGDKADKLGPFKTHVIVLGRYSLFAYIAQIAILQFLHRLLSHGKMSDGVLSVSFVLGFALTMACVEAVDRMRPRWRALDHAYRVAFA